MNMGPDDISRQRSQTARSARAFTLFSIENRAAAKYRGHVNDLFRVCYVFAEQMKIDEREIQLQCVDCSAPLDMERQAKKLNELEVTACAL